MNRRHFFKIVYYFHKKRDLSVQSEKSLFLFFIFTITPYTAEKYLLQNAKHPFHLIEYRRGNGICS